MMRTRLLVLLVILAAAFALSGCGSGSSTTFTPATPQVSVDSVTVSTSQTEPGQGPVTLTASLTGDSTGAGVTFGASCDASQCGTVTTTSPLSATYTPPTGTLGSTLTVTVTATSNKDSSKLRSVKITVMPKVVVPAAASAPVTASINTPLNVPLVAPGTGAPPFNLIVVPGGSSSTFGVQPGAQGNNCGAVPAWLMSLFDAQHGTISGTVPGSATDFNCSVAVKDALGVTTPSVTLQITVPILFQAGSLPGAEQGQTGYAATLANFAQGGSGAYSFSSSLPDGLSLGADGSISGNIGGDASDLSFTANVTDSKGASKQQSFTILVTTVASVDSVTSSAAQIEQGQPSLMLTATLKGKAAEVGVTWTASCLVSQCGTISSTSPTTASYNPPTGSLTESLPVTLTATSIKNPKKSKSVTITVVPAVAVAQPAPASLIANIGNNFSLILQTSAGTGIGPFTWTLANGSTLPTWLNLSSGGVLTATQVPNTATTSQFTVRVTDSVGITAPLALTVTVPTVSVTITTTSLPSGEQTQASYSTILAAQGGSGTFSWKIASGSLPAGLNLASNGSISGSPAANATTQTFTLQVTDTANSANTTTSQPLTLTIIPALAISSPTPAGLVANIGSAFNLVLQTSPGTGSGAVSWNETSGNLSKLGLSLASSTGVISGLQVPSTATTQQVTLQATDSLNVAASLPVTITVPTKIITSSLPGAEQTQASYSAVLTAQGGSGTYLWTVASGSLPAGLNLASSGTISGSPAANATTQTFTVQVADSANPANTSTSQPLTLAINPQVAIVVPTAANLMANIGGNFNLTLQTGEGTGTGPFTWSLANGSVLPAWLNLSSGGVLSATQVPTTGNTVQFTVQVTDAANVTASLPLTVTVPVKIVPPSLPNGEQTQTSYSAALTAQGGSGTYSWTVALGSLPAGLNLAANGSISGSPAANATTQTFTVQVADAANPSNTNTSQPLTITINSQVAIAVPTPANLQANIGNNFSLTLQTTADTGVGPFTWTLANGSTLPSWLSLSNGGVLSATQVPTSANNAQFTVQVTDSAGVTASLQLNLTVPIKIVASPLPSAEQTQAAYTASLTAQGGSGGYTWSASPGSLPSGLTLAPNGSISGSPTADATTQTFTVQVADSTNATASQQFTITINPKVAIAAPSAASLLANIGNNFNLNLQTNAGTGIAPFTWALANASTLPPWLSLSNAGVLSATQVPTTALTSTFTVQVTDSAGVTASLPMTVTVAIKVLTTALPVGEATAPYSTTTAPVAQGGSGSYTWSATGLPAWATINPSTGAISGANPTPGSSNVTITAADTANPTNIGSSQSLTLTINAQLAIAQPAPDALVATIGNPFNLALQASPGTGSGTVTWSETSQNLSKLGLTISSTTGAISGVLVPTTATTQQITVQAEDSLHVVATLSVTITVPIKIITGSLSNGEVTAPYSSAPLSAQGGSGTYTWSATGLPVWATINPNTGVISGNPTQGSSNLTITATDSLQATASVPLTLTILPVVTVNAASLADATLNAPYPSGQMLTATGGVQPYKWQLSAGTLPTGLSLDKDTGIISGTPVCPVVATSTFSVTVQDFLSITSAPQQFSIKTTSNVPLTILTTSIPGDTIGVAYSQQLNASGGGCTLTWSVASGSLLPSWLQLSSGGLLTGTPGAGDVGSTTFTVQVTDGTATVQQALTILVTSNLFKVSGQVSLVNNGGPLAGVVVDLGSNLSATTDGNGNFTIQNVAAGTYTATLGFPSAPSSAFLPASTNITNTNGVFTISVNNGDLTGVNFNAALGFTVSGTLSYAGILNPDKFNRVFVSLQPTNCNGCSVLGTTAVGPRSPFIINGVPPGTYTVNAFMDYPGYGVPNAFDPIGTNTVTVAMANVTNVAVAMNDPSLVGAIPGPGLKATAIESGVIIQYTPIVQNGVEQPLLYNLQWVAGANNNAACETAPDGGYLIFDAQGDGNPIIAGSGRTVILDSNNQLGPAFGEFQDGLQYSICMQGLKFNPSVGFTQGGWQPINPAVTIGPPTGGAGTNTISGNVIIPDTANPSGPLYAGCYDTKTGKIYSDVNEGPLVTASLGGNPYSVSGVPTGASCFLFAMIDQDSDGFITPTNPTSSGQFFSTLGDIYNTNSHSPTTVTIAGNTVQDIDLTPFAFNSNPNVSTQHVQAVNLSGNTQESYNLNFLVTPLISMPTEVTLLSGPNVVAPADFALCTTCGEQAEFNVSLNTNGVRPQVGDSYLLQITYSDTTLAPEVVTLTVTGVSDAFADSLTPIGATPGTTPTFRWTDPLNPSNYLYRFLLSDATGNTIWQIPGPNSFLGFSTFFSNSIVSVPWVTPPSGKDPTGATNPPSVAALTSGATYTWSITVQDSNGNSTLKQVRLVP